MAAKELVPVLDAAIQRIAHDDRRRKIANDPRDPRQPDSSDKDHSSQGRKRHPMR